ncbi:Biotin transporter BioY [Candidatus Izimaplasma bacterium HR1]|jgi:biotin transport system substrate-specific component|uniref:biotin transporter BioY n=1 Tax=Candidatus Izimoplasma sp. HR1 TaxID=1541959 RepID=UPI0004F8193B|nr:Biotin transporter BioY [Candidatus Izimaplasma bacterium HR1]
MNNRTRELTMIALFPALMGATAGISIPLFNLPPITLQTFFVFLAGLTLGPKKGALSMIIYLIIGAIGIPVFSGFRGGLEILTGFSGGFLVGFVFAAFFVGFMKTVKILNNNILSNFTILLGANLIIYMFGAAYIAFLTSTSIWPTLSGLSIYLIGDLLKITTTLYVYVRIRSAFTYEWA